MTTAPRSSSGKPVRKPAKRRPSRPSKVNTSVRSGSWPAVELADVRLERGAGGAGRGGGPGGAYWHVYVGPTRAGNVYINVIDEPPVGEHASIQIQINKAWQGRGVGRTAYGLACEASDHDQIYAHMRKSNIGSRKAAEHAGFVVVDRIATPQLLMVWTRPKTRRS